jgi:hypothetical protein
MLLWWGSYFGGALRIGVERRIFGNDSMPIVEVSVDGKK